MPGVRFERFLASTALALLLSLAAGSVRAETSGQPGANAAAPDSSTLTTPAASDNGNATQDASGNSASSGATGGPSQAPISAAPTDQSQTPTPAASADQSQAPVSAAPADQPQTPTPTASTDQPQTPTPAASNQQPQTPSPTAATEPSQTTPAGAAAPAASPAAATTPSAAPVESADVAIGAQLHGLADGKFDRIVGGKKDRIAIDAFYVGRNYAPLWLTDGQLNDRAKAAISYLGHVDDDGLDPADYPIPDFAASSDPASLAEAELRLSMSVITYAHHAAVGRVHWSRVSADIEYTDKPPEPAEVLGKVAGAEDVATALASYEPQTPGYLALKAKLAEIRGGNADTGNPPLPRGPVLKIGAQDDRVPQLRERLGITGDGTTYDKPLAEAVKKFQREHDLKPSGLLTAPTIAALNGKKPDRPVDIILANLERWRWMPHHFPNTYVIVNLPDYSLQVMHDGKPLWKTKIVIGKPGTATPLMVGEMKFITVNPTWNVPPSIVNNEYLPALRQDPTVLERMGLRVGRNADGTVHIWQPPGDKNALGRIRFNFPNKFLVYQHDTPDKYLFAYDKRAFSHGCMRVQDPLKYAEVLLSLVRPGDDYTEERLRRMFGPEETNIPFPTNIPVYLTYQTAFVDGQGKLEFRDDIYGRDRTELALLKSTGEERRVVDIAVEHKEDTVRRQVLAIPDQPSLWGGRGYYPGAPSDGQGFFARLFGSFSPAPPPPTPRRSLPRRRETRSNQTYEQ